MPSLFHSTTYKRHDRWIGTQSQWVLTGTTINHSIYTDTRIRQYIYNLQKYLTQIADSADCDFCLQWPLYRGSNHDRYFTCIHCDPQHFAVAAINQTIGSSEIWSALCIYHILKTSIGPKPCRFDNMWWLWLWAVHSQRLIGVISIIPLLNASVRF